MISSHSISREAQRVLGVVGEHGMDGYALLSKTRLEPGQLVGALQQLSSESLVAVKGDLDEYSVGDAYVYVPPGAQSYVHYLLKGLTA